MYLFVDFFVYFRKDNFISFHFIYIYIYIYIYPYGKRFITSGKGGALEKLSMVIGICLKALLKIILSDARYHKSKTGNNRDPVINFIKKGNMNHEINKDIKTFDFETLYTSIP